MRRRRLQRETTEAILAGTVHPEDLPDDRQQVAVALLSLRDHEPVEPPDELLTAMSRAARGDGASPVVVAFDLARRRFATKVALAVGAVGLAATGAAAATGSLPDPAQDGLSRLARQVGVELPTSDDDADDDTVEPSGAASSVPQAASSTSFGAPAADESDRGDLPAVGVPEVDVPEVELPPVDDLPLELPLPSVPLSGIEEDLPAVDDVVNGSPSTVEAVLELLTPLLGQQP